MIPALPSLVQQLMAQRGGGAPMTIPRSPMAAQPMPQAVGAPQMGMGQQLASQIVNNRQR